MTTEMIFTLCALGLMVCVAIALGCLLRATETERWKAVVELCTAKGRYESLKRDAANLVQENLRRKQECTRLREELGATRSELNALIHERDSVKKAMELCKERNQMMEDGL